MKILIAEDEPQIARKISQTLSSYGFQTDVAPNGTEALESIKKGRYSGLLLDIMMPEKSGFNVINTLRAQGNNIPILVISSRTMVQDKIYALNAGADDYISKNYCPQELIARLKAVIRRQAKKSNNFLNCGPLHINLDSMEIFLSHKKLDLTKKEKTLIYNLMEKKNEMIAREDLKKILWKKGSRSYSENTLDTLVSHVRKKIDVSGQPQSFIQTVRGQGYRLVDGTKVSV